MTIENACLSSRSPGLLQVVLKGDKSWQITIAKLRSPKRCGFLAVPVMTTGAAYDLAQTVGWKHSLHAKPAQAKKFYGAIIGFTVLAVLMNFLGINPMKALVFSGIVQGFSTPPLMLMIMLMTNNRKIMGSRVNRLPLNILGWLTTAIMAAVNGM